MVARRIDNLPQLAIVVAIRGATEWLQANNLVADDASLVECVKSWCRIKFPAAVMDARQAYEAGQPDAAILTFDASMVQAGIEAAKEASWPSEMLASA
jgi:hypothetical protein